MRQPTAARAPRRALLLLACLAGSAAAQGDDCTTAPFIVGPGLYPTSLFGLGSPGSAPPCDGIASPGDGWWLYIPTSVGFATISLCASDGGSTGTFGPGQSVLAVWDQAFCPIGVNVACSTGDPCCGGAPRCVVPLVVGQQYYVQIDYAGLGPTVGADACLLAIIESPTPPPPNNDECVCAIPVFNGCNGPFNNASATTSVPTGSCGVMQNDLWFSFLPTSGCTAIITTCGSSFDTVLSVWNFCPVAGGTEIACNNNAPKKTWPSCWGTTQSYVEVPIVPGNMIYISVGGNAGATGNFQIEIRTEYVYLIEEVGTNLVQGRHVNGCAGTTALTVLHLSPTPYYFIGGNCPHVGTGLFFGIDASLLDVINSVTFYFANIAPFFAQLDGCGNATVGPYSWGGPPPYIDAVAFSLTSSFSFCAISPPIRYL